MTLPTLNVGCTLVISVTIECSLVPYSRVMLAIGKALDPDKENLRLLGKSRVAWLEETVISAGLFSTTDDGDGEGVMEVTGDGDGEIERAGEGLTIIDGINVGVAAGEGGNTDSIGLLTGVIEGNDAAFDGPQAVKLSIPINKVINI
jgi:hypothetical protein